MMLEAVEYEVAGKTVAVCGEVRENGTLRLFSQRTNCDMWTARTSFCADKDRSDHTIGGLLVEIRCPKYVREAFDRYAAWMLLAHAPFPYWASMSPAVLEASAAELEGAARSCDDFGPLAAQMRTQAEHQRFLTRVGLTRVGL